MTTFNRLPLIVRASLACMAASAFGLMLILGAAFATGKATVDHYGGAYGVSIGSDSNYLSIDLLNVGRDVLAIRPAITWQHAQ